jgi:hypothetical protein
MISSGGGSSVVRLARRGTGALLASAVLMLTVMLTAGISGQLHACALARAEHHVADLQLALEAADAALAESVVHLRSSMDTGATSPAVADDWRNVVFEALLFRDYRPTLTVAPVATRGAYAGGVAELRVSDVAAMVAFATVLRAPRRGARPRPPQGLLDLSVTVEVQRGSHVVRRTLTQRRLFYLARAAGTEGRGSLASPEVDVHLVPDPAGTVIE